MIVVRVDKWPGGDATKATNLGVVAIANRGPSLAVLPRAATAGDTDLYDYEVMLQPLKGRRRRAYISHYRRRGVWKLVERAMEAISG